MKAQVEIECGNVLGWAHTFQESLQSRDSQWRAGWVHRWRKNKNELTRQAWSVLCSFFIHNSFSPVRFPHWFASMK